MKKKSKKKLFIWLGSILGALILIVCIGGYFAINYASDKVLDAMFEAAVNNEAGAESAKPSTPSPSASDTAAEEAGSSPTASESAQPGNSEEAKPPQETSTSPLSEPSTEPAPSPSYTAEISTDKAEAVKEDISFSEKTKVMTVMLKRLSVDDIKTLQDLASGGLTIEKKKEAKALILQKLTEQEYDDLIKIAKKYGLSQGKSYSDSQSEDLTN